MTDLTHSITPALRGAHIPGLDLGPEAVHPAYDGLSILNVPSTLAGWLGAPPLPHPSLRLEGIHALTEGAHQIIVVLIDAVSFGRFRAWMDRTPARLASLVERGLFAPLTSVVPSTTTAALTTLWTGRSPAEHGQVGYELFLREYGVVANMLNHSPMSLDGQPGLLHRAGLIPEAALPVPTFGAHLASAGIEAHAFLPHVIRNSGLSRMHLQGARVHGYATLADLWAGVRELVQASTDLPRLIWAYYGEVDALSHRYGPDSERAESEFVAVLEACQRLLLDRLAPDEKRESVIVFLSDHGQIATSPDPHYELRSHPSLARRLHMQPTGENRLAYLFIRPGQVEAVAEYFSRTWPQGFHLLPSDYALECGLLGPGEPAPATRERLGDRIAIARGSAFLWWAPKENVLIGRHGGVSPDEMLVPFLAARLG
jgi:hypothetical protein